MRFSTNHAMLANYFKTAVRNLAKNRFFTILNVFGLALGMSISLLFIAMLTFLYRFDNFHEKKDQIYRVTTLIQDNKENPQYASAPAGLAQKFRDDFTGIEKVVAIHGSLNGEANYLGKKINLNGYFTEPEFLEVFNFPLLKGNVASALSQPNTIVLTETEATKIFDSKDPLGEVMRLEPYGDFIITGILKNLPKNTHMQFEALASYSTLKSHSRNSLIEGEESWNEFSNSYIYIRLPENAEPSRVQHYLDQIAKEKYGRDKGVSKSFELQSLNDITPGMDLKNAIGVQWDNLSVILVGFMTLILLLPACSNYVNLSISQSLKRMKEIGVRKVMGGQKSQIVFQFIMETTITMLLALVGSYFIFEMIRDQSLEILAGGDTLELTPSFLTVLYFILFALLVAFAAGIIPAIYFSKIKPVMALKGKPEPSRKGMKISLRKVVITAQFILSLGFTMAVVIILQQYRYSVNYDFGFQQQNILDVPLDDVDPQRFKAEFGKLSSVERISMSSHVPGLGYSPSRYLLADNQMDSIEASAMAIDEKFISNLELKFIAGKDFTDHPTDNLRSIIVNEEFVKGLHIPYPADVINKSISFADGKEVTIRGVVKNFHYASLRDPIKSFFFEYDPAQFRYANLKVTSADAFSDKPAMQAMWKSIGGEDTFRTQLLTDEIKEAYSFYFILIKLWGFLGLLAITVACLGLLGTVVFTLRNRLKEVSIRKVMGASSGSLVYLLSKDFISLMLFASMITVPVIYFLFDFLLLTVQHYSVQIGFVEIGTSLMIIMVLGLSTILSQTRKAANANPVDNLRSE